MLQVDGYAGFETLATKGDIVLAACWAHARRKFYEFHQATGSPIAAETLRRIAELYAVEKRHPLIIGRIRGRIAGMQLVDDLQHLDQFVPCIDKQFSCQDIFSVGHYEQSFKDLVGMTYKLGHFRL